MWRACPWHFLNTLNHVAWTIQYCKYNYYVIKPPGGMLLVYNPDSRELQAWESTDIINHNIPTVRCYNWFILLLLGDSATLHEVRTLFEKEPVDDCQCQKCGRECKELFRLGMKDWTASSNFDSPGTRVALVPIDAGGCRKILRFSLPKKRVGKKNTSALPSFALLEHMNYRHLQPGSAQFQLALHVLNRT